MYANACGVTVSSYGIPGAIIRVARQRHNVGVPLARIAGEGGAGASAWEGEGGVIEDGPTFIG